MTANRLVVWAGRGKHIDVPLTEPFRTAVAVTAERGDRLCFTYPAGHFHASRSGTVDVRLRTRHAPRLAELVAALRA